MDLSGWIGLAFGIVCALIAHIMGKRSGKTALQEDIKVRLREIQKEAEIEAGEIEQRGERQIDEIDKSASKIKSADDSDLIDEFNDAFSGE